MLTLRMSVMETRLFGREEEPSELAENEVHLSGCSSNLHGLKQYQKV